MSDSEINLVLTSSGGDRVVAAVGAVGDKADESAKKVDGLGASGKKAGDEVTAGAKPAVQALNEVEAAEKKLEEALKRLETAQGPRALTKASRDATLAMMEYRGAAEAAGVATVAMGARVDGAKVALVGAGSKIALMKEEMGAMRTQGAFAAEGMESLGARAGSLGGMLTIAKQSGSSLTKAMGEMGLGAIALVAGFDMATKAGEWLGKELADLVDKQSGFDAKARSAADKLDLETNALRSAANGQIQYGNSLAETVTNYEHFSAKAGMATMATDAFIKKLDEMKPPKNLKEAQQNFSDFSVALSGMYKKGEAEGAAFLLSQQKTIDMMVQGYATMGKRIPAELLAIVTATKEAAAAQKLLTEEGAKAAIKALDDVRTAREKDKQSLLDKTAAVQKSVRDEMKANDEAGLSQTEWSAKKKALYEQELAASAEYYAKSVADEKAATVAQSELRAKLELSGLAYAKVEAAVTKYNDDINRGIEPTDAMKTATAGLEKSIEASGEALPQLNKNLLELADHGMKAATDQTKAAKDQAAEFVGHATKAGAAVGEMGAAFRFATDPVQKFGTALQGVFEQMDLIEKKSGTLKGVLAALAGGGSDVGA